ncbi:gliding motility lipoprotein GldD [Arenibacter latericius]|uniref:gliding motility lipoprotein GldD n=1 Tax=Arenibacter latericius TaxID=86104 RepID=UPI0003F73D73|nr:gliding motility lipoprotein GldD [Arenibacter latericius]MDX1364593.1 gliding motility lipoprotein GldD [Arenibacter latericius]
MKYSLTIIILSFLLIACQGEVLPKPNALLRLDYPDSEHTTFQADHFTIDRNTIATIKSEKGNSFILDYPLMQGSVFITYKNINGNLDKLLTDAQRLSYEHAVKADNILEQPFVNEEDRVYGMYYEVKGNAASQAQFYVTDSTEHFVTGSLYFHARPNYDSILPAAAYLQNDIRRIMETLKWNN